MPDIIQYAEQKIGEATATFSAAHGGAIELVGGTERALAGASHILSSLGQATNIAAHAGIGAAIGMMASLPLVHELGSGAAAFAASAGGIANIISSVTGSPKGRGGR